MNAFTAPSSETLEALLRHSHVIAVVGLSPKTHRASCRVAGTMQQFGYHVIPVRPGLEAVLGEPAYPDLYAVPGPIDLGNVFRAPYHVGPIVEACIALGIAALWLQPRVVNEATARRAVEAGMTVVMDRCISEECLRLQ